MRAGLLTERIEFQNPVLAKTSTGYEETFYEPSFSCRAYVKPEKAERSIINDEILFSQSVKFQIRNHFIVNSLMRISWKNETYRITGIIEKKTEQLLEITTEKIDE